MMTQADWIMSDGGPLICVEKRLEALWGGIDNLTFRDGSGAKNDYERACQVIPLIATIPLAAERAIILGDMPLNTTFWKCDGDSMFIARLRWAEPDVDIADLFSKIQNSKLAQLEPPIGFYSKTSNFVLFDAVETGGYEYNSITSFFPVGNINISTFLYEPNALTSMYLHKIESVD